MQRCLPQSSWVFWSDADSLITNPEIRLEGFLHDDADLIIGEDSNGINSGQWFLRNCAWSVELLQRVWDSTEWIDHGWWEQKALMELMVQERYRERVQVVNQRLFNSYPGCWEPGDFILHFPGSDVDKEALMKGAAK
jgi:hypothetical protein